MVHFDLPLPIGVHRAAPRSAQIIAAPSDLTCKIRSYLRPNFAAIFTDFRQLVRARSRLYRSRFLQPNTHFDSFCSAFRDLQEYHSFAPLQIQYFSKFSSESFRNFQNFFQKFAIFHNFHRIFRTNLDENFSEFRQIL